VTSFEQHEVLPTAGTLRVQEIV